MKIRWLEAAPYDEMYTLQQSLRQQISAGDSQEYLLIVEHTPCITLGKRGGTIDYEKLPTGTTIHQINRGGLATWHGPGQLVFYPIINLRQRKIGIRNFICGLEQSVLDLLSSYGISATRKKGTPGLWIDDHKIASIGLQIKNGISMHGIALNICNQMDGFAAIAPCGFAAGTMTAMIDHVDSVPEINQAGARLAQIFGDWLTENSTPNS